MSIQSFNQNITLSENYVYFTRADSLGGVVLNSAGRWDGEIGTLEMIGNGTGTVGGDEYLGRSILAINDSNIIVAGGFASLSYIARSTGGNFTSINSGQFDAPVANLAYDAINNRLYAASGSTSTTSNKVSYWDGTSWTAINSGVGAPTGMSGTTYLPRLTIDTRTGDLYLGFFNDLHRYNFGSSTWTQISSNVGGTITDIKYNRARNSIFFNNESESLIKYYNIDDDTIYTLPTLSSYISQLECLDFDADDNLYAGGWETPEGTYENLLLFYDGYQPTDLNGTWVPIFGNFGNSASLGVTVDGNKNIFVRSNSGYLNIGKYVSGTTWNWTQTFSNVTTSITFGGLGANSQGDPHITTLTGEKYDLVTNGSFRFFDNNVTSDRFYINATAEYAPYKIWEDKEYIKKIFIKYKNYSCLIDTGFRGGKARVINSFLETKECLECGYSSNDEKRCKRHEKEYDHKMKLMFDEDQKSNDELSFTIIEKKQSINKHCQRFCSDCSYRSNDDKRCSRHESQFGHRMLSRVRNAIKVIVKTKLNKYHIEVTNVDENNFEPCKVSFKMDNKLNVDTYRGAIVKVMKDYSMDIKNIYDKKLFDE